jgi:hypothetical protein
LRNHKNIVQHKRCIVMLNKNQVEEFKQNGILIIRDFFSAAEIEHWNNEALAFYNYPVSAEDWRLALIKYGKNNFHFTKDPSPDSYSKMKLLYACLNKNIAWIGENEIEFVSPQPDAEWLGPRLPHLDFPVYDSIRTLVNCVFYLSDVPVFGGPFMYWPKSHIVSWDYFKENPEDYMAQGDIGQDEVFIRIKKRIAEEAIQFAGKAGDLLIWHSLILHSGSINKSLSARKAVFGRWGERLKENEKHFDFDRDIWSGWDFTPHEKD